MRGKSKASMRARQDSLRKSVGPATSRCRACSRHRCRRRSRLPIRGCEPNSLPSPASVPGGSGVLTAQSQCAFKAFATARLGAQDWEPAEAGLTAAERGQLLHAVLHAVWGGPPDGYSHARRNLLPSPDLAASSRATCGACSQENMPARARERMPQRYLELEETRLIRLGDGMASVRIRARSLCCGRNRSQCSADDRRPHSQSAPRSHRSPQ